MKLRGQILNHWNVCKYFCQFVFLTFCCIRWSWPRQGRWLGSSARPSLFPSCCRLSWASPRHCWNDGQDYKSTLHANKFIMEQSDTSNYNLLYFLSSAPWSSSEWLVLFVSRCGDDIFQRATEIWKIFLRLQNVWKRDASCYIYCCNDYIRLVSSIIIMMPWWVTRGESSPAQMTECES